MNPLLHAVAVSSKRAITYNLQGESGIDGSQPLGTSNAGIRINSDGTIDKLVDSVYTQIDAATDWIIPNGADKSTCEFKCTNTGDALEGGLGSQGASSSTGSFISPPCLWYIETDQPFPKTLTLSVEISIDSGSSTHDTGSYTGSCEA